MSRNQSSQHIQVSVEALLNWDDASNTTQKLLNESIALRTSRHNEVVHLVFDQEDRLLHSAKMLQVIYQRQRNAGKPLFKLAPLKPTVSAIAMLRSESGQNVLDKLRVQLEKCESDLRASNEDDRNARINSLMGKMEELSTVLQQTEMAIELADPYLQALEVLACDARLHLTAEERKLIFSEAEGWNYVERNIASEIDPSHAQLMDSLRDQRTAEYMIRLEAIQKQTTQLTDRLEALLLANKSLTQNRYFCEMKVFAARASGDIEKHLKETCRQNHQLDELECFLKAHEELNALVDHDLKLMEKSERDKKTRFQPVSAKILSETPEEKAARLRAESLESLKQQLRNLQGVPGTTELQRRLIVQIDKLELAPQEKSARATSQDGREKDKKRTDKLMLV